MISFVIRPLGDRRRNYLDPLHVNLQLDLQKFLGMIEQFPAVRRLSNLCVYDESEISGKWLLDLTDDLEELRRNVQDNTLALQVPDEVGVTSDEDLREPFGREVFLGWLENLHTLCIKARTIGVPLLACGD